MQYYFAKLIWSVSYTKYHNNLNPKRLICFLLAKDELLAKKNQKKPCLAFQSTQSPIKSLFAFWGIIGNSGLVAVCGGGCMENAEEANTFYYPFVPNPTNTP